jgi:O-antigen/teichoic acid export membrane protein
VRRAIENLRGNVLDYVPSNLLPAIINVLSISIYTRMILPEDFGYFSIYTTTIWFGGALLSRWLEQGILKYSSRFDHNTATKALYFWNVCIIVLELMIGLTILMVISCTIPFFFRNVTFTIVVILFILLQTQVAFNVLLAYLQSQQDSKSYRKFNILFYILRFSFSILALFLISRSLWSILVAYLLAQAIVNIAAFSSLIKNVRMQNPLFQTLSWRKNIYFVRRFFSYGSPIILYSFGCQLLTMIDKYSLTYFLGASQTGLYAPSYNIASMGINLMTTPFLLALHPILLKYQSRSEDLEEYRILSAKILRYFIVVSFFLLGGAILIHEEVSAVIFGASYASGSVVIPIVTFSYLVFGLSQFVHKPTEIEGKTRLMAVGIGVSVVVNIVGNLLVIHEYSFVGSSVILAFSHLTYLAVMYVLTHKSKFALRFKTQELLRPAILFAACTVVSLMGWMIVPHEGLWPVVKLLIYFGLFFVGMKRMGYDIRISSLLRMPKETNG